MQVTGHVIRSRYMYVRKRGDDAYQRVLAELGPEARALMESGPLETNWYPYEVYVELSTTIDRVLGNGDLQLVFEMGSFSCEHNLTGIYRVFFRFGNLNFLINRAAKAWHSQYDFGVMTVARDPDNKSRVTLELSEVPRPSRVLFLAVKGWVVKAAELSGSELVRAEDEFSEDPGAPMRWVFEYL
ncbi:hypothetical protein ENSA5_07040 [Enhygromyxa salina]|uniref:Uncharacterized protein n=1 Tax=Enhygromyxa salina TaxID=215803 RepID=A0A2S9YH71_9BACT|nr:hypothetical protein [Enhygromyxa salina]PRQ04473.1 hypothetical protein ENSA5_07040 [Enhygromyxa salina]